MTRISHVFLAIGLAFVMSLSVGQAWAQQAAPKQELATNADDQDQVVATAKTVLGLIKDGKFNTVWNTHISAFFKKNLNQDVFVGNLSQGRVNAGLMQSSRLVDVTYSAKDILSGYVGNIYTVRFLNKYEHQTSFDYVILIREADGQWRVSAMGGAPAPND